MKVAWIEAVAKLGVKSQAGAILARLQSDPQAPVRVAALAALQTLAVPELEPGVRAAMTDADTTVRTRRDRRAREDADSRRRPRSSC